MLWKHIPGQGTSASCTTSSSEPWALSKQTTIQIEDLPDAFRDPGPAITLKLEPSLTRSTLAASKDEVERVQITAALERNGNNRLRARGGAGHQPHDPLQEAAQTRSHGIVNG